ncbi:MAG: DNA polymerase II, partial [Thermoplasmatales archaeon]
MEDEIRVVSSSYITNNEGVIVELFGRNRVGESFTLLYRGFNPYFQVVEPTDEEVERLKSSGEVVLTENVELLYKGKKVRAVKFTLRSPWKVPELRRMIQDQGRVLAADIPFHFRFYYDFDLGSCVKFLGEEVKDKRFTTKH